MGDDAHTKGASHARYGGANMAEGIDAEGAPEQARTDRRMPLAVLQALHFIGQMAQRRQDHAPRQLGSGGIGTTAPAAPASGNRNAVLGTGSNIEVIGVAPCLANALEIGQALDHTVTSHIATAGGRRVARGEELLLFVHNFPGAQEEAPHQVRITVMTPRKPPAFEPEPGHRVACLLYEPGRRTDAILEEVRGG